MDRSLRWMARFSKPRSAISPRAWKALLPRLPIPTVTGPFDEDRDVLRSDIVDHSLDGQASANVE